MRMHALFLLVRFRSFSRRVAGHFGLFLKRLSRQLILFSEKETKNSWGAELAIRLPFNAELEMVRPFSIYRGRIYATDSRFSFTGAKMKVVLRLNWVATTTSLEATLDSFLGRDIKWVFSGPRDIVIDPSCSPLHEADGALWFMCQGGYGVIRFNHEKFLPFSGSPDIPRVYKYF